MYLASSGQPTDICLELGKACYLTAGNGRGGMFLFLLFLHFNSFSFLPCPLLSSPLLIYLSSPFLLETTQNDRTQGLTCH